VSLRQWERLGDAGDVDPSRPARCELTVDLRLHNGLDEDVASQSDVKRSNVGRGREQGGCCLCRLAEQVIDAPLYPLHEATVVPIVLMRGGFVEESLRSAWCPSGAARARSTEESLSPIRFFPY
jgi:hypothetical protein